MPFFLDDPYLLSRLTVLVTKMGMFLKLYNDSEKLFYTSTSYYNLVCLWNNVSSFLLQSTEHPFPPKGKRKPLFPLFH